MIKPGTSEPLEITADGRVSALEPPPENRADERSYPVAEAQRNEAVRAW
jgi:hypothetical protein